MAADQFDVAVVGAGPNGLTAAAYLGRAGARVVILERRFERGGTFATDDYSTPYQYNIAQFELPLGEELPPYRDLDLRSQGVRFVEPGFPFSARTGPGEPELVVGRSGQGLGDEVERMLAEACEAVAPLLYQAPKEGGVPMPALAGVTPSALAATVEDPRAAVMLRYACGLAGFLEGDTPLGPIGAYSVARLFEPQLVVGGTKNLANALARVAVGAGARALVSAEVSSVERNGSGFRLVTADKRELFARVVISTLDPRATFVGLLGDGLASPELQAAAERWVDEETGQFTAHYGIKGEPPRAAHGEALMRVFGFSEAGEVERHFAASLRGELPDTPAGHLTAVSVHDPFQASPGPYGPLHTLRLQTVVPFEHPDGDWDRMRTSYRKECWRAVVAHFSGLEDARLLFQFCDTPLDIQRRFATTRRGSIRQGALVAEQTLVHRPHRSCSSGRTPIQGLYVGGGAVHPGVPGSLGGGYNAARAVAEDLGIPFARCT